MKRQFLIFLSRWVLNSLGLWIAIRLLGNFGAELTAEESVATFLLAGLIFSIVNTIVRPVILILSLPFILLTLGLFMLIVNGIMVWISIILTPGINISFGAAILAGIIMSLINYVITNVAELNGAKESTSRP